MEKWGEVMSRRIAKAIKEEIIVLATLKQALATGYTPAIFHSDQGTEFMAQACTDYLEQRGIHISVSDTASPWQNGFIESFFGRFKQEFGDINRFETAGEMLAAVYQHIHYYNHRRIHTALSMP